MRTLVLFSPGLLVVVWAVAAFVTTSPVVMITCFCLTITAHIGAERTRRRDR